MCLQLPYGTAFREAAIDGPKLIELDDERLSSLGVENSHLQRLVSHIAVFRSQLGRSSETKPTTSSLCSVDTGAPSATGESVGSVDGSSCTASSLCADVAGALKTSAATDVVSHTENERTVQRRKVDAARSRSTSREKRGGADQGGVCRARVPPHPNQRSPSRSSAAADRVCVARELATSTKLHEGAQRSASQRARTPVVASRVLSSESLLDNTGNIRGEFPADYGSEDIGGASGSHVKHPRRTSPPRSAWDDTLPAGHVRSSTSCVQDAPVSSRARSPARRDPGVASQTRSPCTHPSAANQAAPVRKLRRAVSEGPSRSVQTGGAKPDLRSPSPQSVRVASETLAPGSQPLQATCQSSELRALSPSGVQRASGSRSPKVERSASVDPFAETVASVDAVSTSTGPTPRTGTTPRQTSRPRTVQLTQDAMFQRLRRERAVFPLAASGSRSLSRSSTSRVVPNARNVVSPLECVDVGRPKPKTSSSSGRLPDRQLSSAAVRCGSSAKQPLLKLSQGSELRRIGVCTERKVTTGGSAVRSLSDPSIRKAASAQKLIPRHLHSFK